MLSVFYVFFSLCLLFIRAMGQQAAAEYAPLRDVRVIPLRFTPENVPWIAVRPATFQFVQFPDHPAAILCGLIDELADDRWATQYRIDEDHVLVCHMDHLIVPGEGQIWMDDGHLRWIRVFAEENELISQDLIWFLGTLTNHRIDRDYLDLLPLNQRFSRANLLYHNGNGEYQTTLRFAKAPLTNFGQTCYMNAAIQMLFHTRAFYVYLLRTVLEDVNGGNRLPTGPEGVTRKLALLFGNMMRPEKDKVWADEAVLRDLYQTMQLHYDDVIIDGQQHDANEFIHQLLLLIIRENNHPMLWGPSFYKDLFSVDREQHTLCNDPDHRRILPRRQYDLLLELSFVAAHQHMPVLDFHDSIRRALAPQYDLNVHDHVGCGLRQVTTIKDLPPILMIKINRTTWDYETNQNVRINGAVNFPFRGLDMGPYVDPNNGLVERYVYDLIGTINHAVYGDFGHYTTTTFHEVTENDQTRIEAHFISDRNIFNNISMRQQLEHSRTRATTLVYACRSQTDPRPLGFDEAAAFAGEPETLFDFDYMYFRNPADRNGKSVRSEGAPRADGDKQMRLLRRLQNERLRKLGLQKPSDPTVGEDEMKRAIDTDNPAFAGAKSAYGLKRARATPNVSPVPDVEVIDNAVEPDAKRARLTSTNEEELTSIVQSIAADFPFKFDGACNFTFKSDAPTDCSVSNDATNDCEIGDFNTASDFGIGHESFPDISDDFIGDDWNGELSTRPLSPEILGSSSLSPAFDFEDFPEFPDEESEMDKSPSPDPHP